MAKKYFPKGTTPVGVAAYAWINKPDEGHKFSDGKYKLTLVLDNDTDLSDLEAKCAEAAEIEWDEIPSELQFPFRSGDDHKNEEFDGKTLINIKSKHRPGVVGPDRKSLPDGVEARSGDMVRCSVIALPYETTDTVQEKVKGKLKRRTVTIRGVTLLLKGVQLIEKRNAGGDVANDFDDAFDADELEAPAAAPTSKENDQSEDDFDDDDL